MKKGQQLVHPASGRCTGLGAASADSPRRIGQVRKSLDKRHWSARFQFTEQGKRLFFEGPLRASKTDAETDRKAVAAVIERVPRQLRAESASKALGKRKNAGTNLSFTAPGSASAGARFSSRKLAHMSNYQLRSLATKTPGVVTKKKNAQGKWVHKTSSELVAALQCVVMKRPAAFKRPSSA